LGHRGSCSSSSHRHAWGCTCRRGSHSACSIPGSDPISSTYPSRRLWARCTPYLLLQQPPPSGQLHT
jgi:hypothetical protein